MYAVLENWPPALSNLHRAVHWHTFLIWVGRVEESSMCSGADKITLLQIDPHSSRHSCEVKRQEGSSKHVPLLRIIMLFLGHPCQMTLQKPRNLILRDLCCSTVFSCSCSSVRSMTIVDRLGLKPCWHFGKTNLRCVLSTGWKWFSPLLVQREISMWFSNVLDPPPFCTWWLLGRRCNSFITQSLERKRLYRLKSSLLSFFNTSEEQLSRHIVLSLAVAFKNFSSFCMVVSRQQPFRFWYCSSKLQTSGWRDSCWLGKLQKDSVHLSYISWNLMCSFLPSPDFIGDTALFLEQWMFSVS